MRRLLVFVPLLVALGCDLSSKPFAGSIIEMTLTSSAPSAPGQHYELWSRNASNDIIRVSGIFDAQTGDATTRLFPFGFVARPAITMDDPCMIDGAGHLLVTAAAYHDDTFAGVFQSAEDQAEVIRARIAQLTSTRSCDGSPEAATAPQYHCGAESATMLGAIAYETVDADGNITAVAPPAPTTCETSGNAPGCIAFGADAATRLAACQAYWATSPLAYTPNPLQLTAPVHGALYGELTYIATAPTSAGADAIHIDSNVSLSGIRELWLTTETKDAVDAAARGAVFLHGFVDHGGIDVVHFDLSPPLGSSVVASGTAAVEVDLDANAIQL